MLFLGNSTNYTWSIFSSSQTVNQSLPEAKKIMIGELLSRQLGHSHPTGRCRAAWPPCRGWPGCVRRDFLGETVGSPTSDGRRDTLDRFANRKNENRCLLPSKSKKKHKALISNQKLCLICLDCFPMLANKVPLPANCMYNCLPFMIIMNPNPQLFRLNLPLCSKNFNDVFMLSQSPKLLTPSCWKSTR